MKKTTLWEALEVIQNRQKVDEDLNAEIAKSLRTCSIYTKASKSGLHLHISNIVDSVDELSEDIVWSVNKTAAKGLFDSLLDLITDEQCEHGIETAERWLKMLKKTVSKLESALKEPHKIRQGSMHGPSKEPCSTQAVTVDELINEIQK